MVHRHVQLVCTSAAQGKHTVPLVGGNRIICILAFSVDSRLIRRAQSEYVVLV